MLIKWVRESAEYAQVVRMLGNGRLEAHCFDGTDRLCHIRGKMRKKQWVGQGDIILISLRDYQDGKADVILKYNADESRQLKSLGHLPDNAKINQTDTIKYPYQQEHRVIRRGFGEIAQGQQAYER